VPERFGGGGAGAIELGVVFEEMRAARFCGPFLSTVGLAVTALIGGCQVAMTALANERVSIGARSAQRGEGPIGRAVETYREAVAAGRADAAATERLMLLWTRAEAARLTNVRAAQAGGLLIDGYAEIAPEFSAAYGGTDVRKSYLRSLPNSIEGGTSEVMRNILGEWVLGLPGEPRVDQDRPWREVRR
jgi:3-oxochol-4-en-24-oyl-CoA dehydrogenase